MIIYLAGFKTIEKHWHKTTNDIYLLSSYLEHKGVKISNYVKQEKHILDSGAFTFLNSKKNQKINWEQYVINYGKFVKENNIKLFFELDIDSIVGLNEVERLRNILEQTAERKCIPVWHRKRGLEYWRQMCKNYTYVAIGGIVTKEIKRSEYDIFTVLLNIAKEYNTKVHGLGFTSMKGIKKYKFYSVDSTSWLAAKYGSIYKYENNNLITIKYKGMRLKGKTSKYHIPNFEAWLKFQKYAEIKL